MDCYLILKYSTSGHPYFPLFYFWSPILSTEHPLSEWAHSGLQYLNFHFRKLCVDHCIFKMKWESKRNWWCFIRTSTIANGSKSHSPMFLYDFPVRDSNNNVSKLLHQVSKVSKRRYVQQNNPSHEQSITPISVWVGNVHITYLCSHGWLLLPLRMVTRHILQGYCMILRK